MILKYYSLVGTLLTSLLCSIAGDATIVPDGDSFQIEFIAERESIERFQVTTTSRLSLRWSYVNGEDSIAGTLDSSLDRKKWLEIEQALESENQHLSSSNPILYIREQGADKPKSILCASARVAGVFLFGKTGTLKEIGPKLIHVNVSGKGSMIHRMVTADLIGGDMSEDLDKQNSK